MSIRIILFAAAGLWVAFSAAFAQEPAEVVPETPGFTPEWESGDLESGRWYPRYALENNISGVATLCCIPTETALPACGVLDSTPDIHDFGQAAQRISMTLRLTEASAQAFRESDEIMRLRVHFAPSNRGIVRRGAWRIEHDGVCVLEPE